MDKMDKIYRKKLCLASFIKKKKLKTFCINICKWLKSERGVCFCHQHPQNNGFPHGNVSSNNALQHWITEVMTQLQVSHHSLSCYFLAAILYQLPMWKHKTFSLWRRAGCCHLYRDRASMEKKKGKL